MSNPAEVKIKILWDSIDAKRAIVDFQQTSSKAQKQVAMDAKISAEATFSQARAVEILEKAALATTRAQLAVAQATQTSARASTIATDIAIKEAKARDAVAAAAMRQVAAADRVRVAGENRQQRDEGFAIRQNQGQAEQRVVMASRVADGAMLSGAAALGGLAYAGEQAGKFETALINMRNNTQMTDQEFTVFKAHIIEMGRSTGASMEQMAGAFMRVKNHSFDMANSLKIVDAATRSAVATGADIEQTANVLAQTMHIFSLNGNQASQAMNTLHQAQLQGNTTMEEFVQNFGLAEAVTSKYGLTLQDTAAITATMTENGLNMAEAGTQIRSVMQHLTAATAPAREEIEKLSKRTGIDLVGDIKALQAGTGSLTKTMIDLSTATGGSAVEINKIIPAQRGAFGVMALTGKASQDLIHNFGQLNDTMSGKLDPTTEALKRKQESLQASINRVNADVETLWIKLGTTVIPILEKGADAVISVVDSFNKLDPAVQSTIVDTIAIGGAFLMVGGSAVKSATSILDLVNGLKLAGISFGGVSTAAAGAEGATAEMATSGAVLLGMGGAYVVAIGAAAAAIGLIVVGWKEAREATEQAAKAAGDYAAQQKNAGSQGEIGQLAVNQQQIAQARSQLQDQITAQKQQDGLIAAAKKRGDGADADNLLVDMKGNPDKFGDSDLGGLQRMIARRDQLDRDHITELNRQHTLIGEGAGTANRTLNATGADGFAKSVLGIAPDSIRTAAINSCAEFVSKVFRQAGDINLPVITGAKALADKVKAMGGTEHGGAALPGDLVLYHGPRFGGRRAGGGRSGYHVGYAIGDGYDEESNNGVAKRGNIDANIKWGGKGTTATFITVPGSTFANASGANPIMAPSKYSGGMFDDPSDKAAKDKAALLVEKAGLQADDAKRAYEKAAALYDQTHSLTYLAAAENLRRAQADREIAEARASQRSADAGKDADPALDQVKFDRQKKDIEAARDADLKKLEEKASGTPEQRRKAAADLAMALLDRKVTAANQAVTRLEALAQATADPSVVSSLQDAYQGQAKAQLNSLRAGLKSQLEDIPATRGNSSMRSALITKEQNAELEVSDTLSANLAQLDEKRAQQQERLAQAARDALASQMAITQAQLAAAQTEDAQKPLRDQAHQQKLSDLELQRQIDQAENNAKFDPLIDQAGSRSAKDQVRAQKARTAGDIDAKYTADVKVENISSGATELSAANDVIKQRADRLRTEASLTDDLTAKMDKLARSYDLLIGIEPDKANAALMQKQKSDEINRIGLTKDSQDAQAQIAKGILRIDPKAITAGLDALKALTTDPRANKQEKQEATGLYQSTVGNLADDKQIGGRDAISRILDGQKDMTAPEIASSVAAAKRILDQMLQSDFDDISRMRGRGDRKNALNKLSQDVETDPLYQRDGLAKGAKDKIDAQKRGVTSSGAKDFTDQIAAGAAQAAPEIMQILFHQKKHESIFKAFWGTFANAGESAISNVLQKTMETGISSLLGSMIPGGSIIGKLLHFSEGGVVPGHGQGDTVPAMLTPGEFVLSHKMISSIARGGTYSPAAPRSVPISGGRGAAPGQISEMPGTPGSGSGANIKIESHIHNPVYQTPADHARDDRRLARTMEKTLASGR